MNNEKNSNIINFGSSWIRYSEYEILKSGDEDYIVPSSDATFELYNPFYEKEGLVLGILAIGDKAREHEKWKNKENEDNLIKSIIDFVNSYGLLGLITSSVHNRDIIGDGKILMASNNYISDEKMLDESLYLKKFMPFASEDDIQFKMDKKAYYVVKREDSPQFYGKRPIALDLVFSKFYCERIDWIIDYSKMISRHFDELLIYRKSEAQLTEKIEILSNQFKPQKISFTVNQLDKPMIVWEFDSLKTAIEVIYGFIVTDDKLIVDRCLKCNSPFVSTNIRSKYCGTTCRNQYNVRKSRNKKMKVEEKEVGISNERRKELMEEYKNLKPDMGAYLIRNKINGRFNFGVTKDLKSTKNGQWFQLKMNGNMNKAMQMDWNEFGEENFEFEILEILEYDKDGERVDYSEDLEILRIEWMTKLIDDGEKSYSKLKI